MGRTTCNNQWRTVLSRTEMGSSAPSDLRTSAVVGWGDRPEERSYAAAARAAVSAGFYRRVKMRWVTPLGELTDSTSNRCSNASSPSQSRSPRPRTMGTMTMCM